MTDLNSISRLQEEQQRTLKDCELMIEKWEKFQEDYVVVDNLLSDLPKKTTHEIMVPIGPLAFMPGNLIHTNEIMVLLGDNWFAERSASQAVEIAKRRLKSVEEYLNNLHEEHKNLLSHIAFTSDIANVKDQSDFKEIKEELSEKDKKRLVHKSKRVAYSKATKDSVKKVDLSSVSEGGTSQECTNDKDLFARLEELERQERMKNEMDNINVTTKKHTFKINKQDVNSDIKKKVKWKGLDEETKTDIVAFPNATTIKFSHSTEVTLLKDDNNRDMILSPADIFNDYLIKKDVKDETQQQPRSILKHSNNEQEVNDSLTRKQNIVSKLEDVTPAYADVVLEHKDVENPGVSTKKEQKHEARKVSKFKAGRMKK